MGYSENSNLLCDDNLYRISSFYTDCALQMNIDFFILITDTITIKDFKKNIRTI